VCLEQQLTDHFRFDRPYSLVTLNSPFVPLGVARVWHERPVLDDGEGPAGATPGALGLRLDVHVQRLAGFVVDAEHGDGGQAHQQLAHARRVGLHKGSTGSSRLGTSRF